MVPLNKNKGSISHQKTKETQEQQTKQEKKDPKGGGCSKYIDNQNLKLQKYILEVASIPEPRYVLLQGKSFWSTDVTIILGFLLIKWMKVLTNAYAF
jgi:hypothetical protein